MTVLNSGIIFSGLKKKKLKLPDFQINLIQQILENHGTPKTTRAQNISLNNPLR